MEKKVLINNEQTQDDDLKSLCYHRLERAFLVGAIAGAIAIPIMISSTLAQFFWGIREFTGSYWFAMGYAASGMLGWTILLFWAKGAPIRRGFVASITLLAIVGMVIVEVASVWIGTMAPIRMIPTWIIQAVLILLFTHGILTKKRYQAAA